MNDPGGSVGQEGILTFGGLGFLIIATELEFWTFPFGSYEVTFEEARGLAGSDARAMIQAVASLVFTLGLIVLNLDLVRARVIPIWAALVLIMGGLATVFLTPVFLDSRCRLACAGDGAVAAERNTP